MFVLARIGDLGGAESVGVKFAIRVRDEVVTPLRVPIAADDDDVAPVVEVGELSLAELAGLGPRVFSVADRTLNIPQLTRPLVIRPSHGSVLDAMYLAMNWLTRERDVLFKARTAARAGVSDRRDAKAQEDLKPPRYPCTLTLVRSGGDET